MLGEEERSAVADVLGGTTLTHGPRVKEFEAAFAELHRRPARHRDRVVHGVAPPRLPVPRPRARATRCWCPRRRTWRWRTPSRRAARSRSSSMPTPGPATSTSTRWRASSRRARARSRSSTTSACPSRWSACSRSRAATTASWSRTARSRSEPATAASTSACIGDIGCFSFYPVKHITTGEGGMVITKRDDVADRVSKQRAFGIDKSVLADRRHTAAYEIEYLGLNYRLGEVGARARRRADEAAARLPRAARAQLRAARGGASRDRRAAGARDRTRRRPALQPLLPRRRCSTKGCATAASRSSSS